MFVPFVLMETDTCGALYSVNVTVYSFVVTPSSAVTVTTAVNLPFAISACSIETLAFASVASADTVTLVAPLGSSAVYVSADKSNSLVVPSTV